MRKLIIAVAAIALIGVAYPAAAQFKSVELQVSGLTCSMCSRSTESSLDALDFVEKIDVDLNNAVFKLQLKDGVPISIDAIAANVQDAGFAVSKLVAYFDFDNLEAKSDEHFKYGDAFYHFVNIKPAKLSGETAITFLDKDLVQPKVHKAHDEFTDLECYNTGYVGHCCPSEVAADAPSEKTRIYHITL